MVRELLEGTLVKTVEGTAPKTEALIKIIVEIYAEKNSTFSSEANEEDLLVSIAEIINTNIGSSDLFTTGSGRRSSTACGKGDYQKKTSLSQRKGNQWWIICPQNLSPADRGTHQRIPEITKVSSLFTR